MNDNPPRNILAISGSLRKGSTNHIILETLQEMAGPEFNFTIFEGLDELPHFSPDILPNDQLAIFRTLLSGSDAVVISTPEYAFGVPGSLKNALDWLVATAELNEKPVAAISASPLWSGGEKALSSLLLTLTALGTVTPKQMQLSIPLVKKKINEERVTDPESLNDLRNLLITLKDVLKAKKNIY